MGTTTEKLTYLQGTKDAIKNAIVAKGVEVPEGTTFRGYAEKVGEIKTGKETKLQKVSLQIQSGVGAESVYYFNNGEFKQEKAAGYRSIEADIGTVVMVNVKYNMVVSFNPYSCGAMCNTPTGIKGEVSLPGVDKNKYPDVNEWEGAAWILVGEAAGEYDNQITISGD